MNDTVLTPSEELLELVRALQEHLMWQSSLGAVGLPRGSGAEPDQPSAASTQQPVREESDPPSSGPMPGSPVPHRASLPPLVEAVVAPPESERRETPSARRVHDVQVPEDPEQRIVRLQELAREVQACTRCPLHAARRQAVFSRGNAAAEILIAGEGPGADEDEQGEPFVGKAGQLLDRMIGAMGLGRDDVYICNVVKCRPPDNRTPEAEEMAACMPYLHEQIALVAPRVILAMGTTAVRGLLSTSEGITRIRGKWKLYRASIPVMPTFHPAYLLRNEGAKRDVWSDLKAVLAQLGKPVPTRTR